METFYRYSGIERNEIDHLIIWFSNEPSWWEWNKDHYRESVNASAFDLTELFGKGNEPKTREEFESYFPNDYYKL